jgi:competence protein ComK
MSKNHLINEKTVLLIGEYDKYGNLCTRVVEGENTFVINESPVKKIDKTLLNYGSSFKGALESSKFILGPIKMPPIKINENKGIWLFPTRSFRRKNCIWFNLKHIIKTKPLGVNKTLVIMNYGHTFIINMKESAFNHRRQKAQQLRESILKHHKHVELKRGLHLSESSDSVHILDNNDEIHSKKLN